MKGQQTRPSCSAYPDLSQHFVKFSSCRCHSLRSYGWGTEAIGVLCRKISCSLAWLLLLLLLLLQRLRLLLLVKTRNLSLHLLLFHNEVFACDLELRDNLFGRGLLVTFSFLDNVNCVLQDLRSGRIDEGGMDWQQ